MPCSICVERWSKQNYADPAAMASLVSCLQRSVPLALMSHVDRDATPIEISSFTSSGLVSPAVNSRSTEQ
ncbi:hypothetical protein PoB_006931200 [Plakobranchus ocellatus]|uniref:Uncharacterized protein n=1 Tax=Plakobranchus ocellatus TaxID=259542 RepID=A0AAV4DEX4_9GAST|nr:hypothetical protein PoB_006931200 [Plakobranchus ocellatus]